MAPIPDTTKIRQERLEELLNEGVTDHEELARIFGCHPHSIGRAMLRFGLATRRPSVTTVEQREWACRAIEEGVFLSWIAETIDLRDRGFAKVTWARQAMAKRDADASIEWSRVWKEIRQDPDLLKLHYEFMPHGSSLGAIAA